MNGSARVKILIELTKASAINYHETQLHQTGNQTMTIAHSNLSLAQLTLMIASCRWKLEEPVLRKAEGGAAY